MPVVQEEAADVARPGVEVLVGAPAGKVGAPPAASEERITALDSTADKWFDLIAVLSSVAKTG